MAVAPNLEHGRDPHLVHSTGSYLFDVDGLIMDMEMESHLMHTGYAVCVQLIRVLEEEVQRWAMGYSKANETAYHAYQEKEHVEKKLHDEIALRFSTEEDMEEVGEDLASLTHQVVVLEEKEEEHLTTISQLNYKLNEEEAKNKDLQAQM